jgi:hypothetical protein
MKLNVKDIVSHMGRDWIVQGVVSYSLDGRALPLARVVDGPDVRWVEPLLDDMDDRFLVLAEISDLNVNTPPPASIAYQGRSYIPRF